MLLGYPLFPLNLLKENFDFGVKLKLHYVYLSN